MVRIARVTLGELARRHGGRVERGAEREVTRVVPIEVAAEGDLAPLTHARFAKAAASAIARGACVLGAKESWPHPNPTWALAEILEAADVPKAPPIWGGGCAFDEHVVFGPRVVIGARVRIGASCVIGRPGFGWAFDGARTKRVPHLGGVVIEDDVEIGPLSTIDAGTLTPTILRRGAKLDAHCHVAHNCDIGEGAMIAAQSGFAGSVRIGARVLIGGQVGVADHVTIGEGARVAAKSGVIGDVPPGAVVAGYPAVPRARWLRALARTYRGLRRT